MKEVIAGAVSILFVLVINISFSWAKEELSPEDQEKMEKLEEMFSSPYSEEMYYRTDRLLLTATGSLVPAHKAPSVASVITSDDIEKIGATTLDEALETVPGLHVAPSNIAYMDSVYSIRGIHTSVNPQVLILMNGIPFTMLYQGSRPPTFRMPVADISRIEVIRGPGSAIYGADAFAGVINIITKDGFEIDGTKGGVRTGSFDTHDYWMQEGGNWNGWNIALSAEYITTNGDKHRIIESDMQSVWDAAFGTNASLAPGTIDTSYNILDAHAHFAKDNWTFRFWSWTQDNAGVGIGVTNTLSDTNEVDVNQYLTDLMYNDKNFASNFELLFRLGYLHSKANSYLGLFPAGTSLPIGADGNLNAISPAGIVTFTDGYIGNPIQIDNQTSVELTGIYSGFNRHRLRFSGGFKYLEEYTEEHKNYGPGVLDTTPLPSSVNGTLTDVTGSAFIYMEPQRRKLTFASLQDEWGFARKWDLTAGIRFDHYSDFGDTLNPRAALVWETRYDLTTKLLYGRAFRAPSFSELFNQNNPLAQGNPNLNPETIETFELAFDYLPALRVHSLLNVFYYKIKDLIEYAPEAGLLVTQNTKDQDGYGLEIEGDWEVTGNLTLKANCAFQRSKDSNTNEIVPDAPALQLYFNAHWIFVLNWSLDGQVYWIGDRHRVTGDTRSDLKNSTITNIILRKKNIFEHWDMAIAAKNVFDEDIREQSSYINGIAAISGDLPMEGRSIWAELTFKF